MKARFAYLVSLAATVLLLVGFNPAYAQVGKLTGVVTDAQTGEALAGAQIFLEGTGRGALTAENGRYFIVNITPGRYTLVVELIGFQSVRRENVQVTIDITRVMNFELTPQAIAVEEIRVEAERTPLIEISATGTKDAITIEDIVTLPITTINDALALRSGFLQVPQNTDIVAFSEENRGITPLRIRGGRNGETLTLIDGVPISNFVFGGPAFQVTPYAVRQIDFIRGGFEPQYGNALSGIINIATQEGGTELAGTVEYRTTEVSGALGSDPDELANQDLFQGSVSGPVPATDERLRFAFAGRSNTGVSRMIEFDDEIFNPFREPPELEGRESSFGIQPSTWDLFPGWRAAGFDEIRDVFGKLTFYATPTAKLNFTVIDYQRQTQPFLFEFLLTGYDVVEACTEQYGDPDGCASFYGTGTQRDFEDVVQGSIRQGRTLYTANWNHTLGRTFYRLTVGRFDQDRESCNYFQGVCLEDRFADVNFTENFIRGGITEPHPTGGTNAFFGGEDLTTWSFRTDLQTQLTDHHNLGAGTFYQTHDLEYSETRDRGTNDVLVVPGEYSADPWEAAFYVQDKIEYDFLTVQLGFRFDFGKAGGFFFSNPLDPTNGTTALDVCDNPGSFQNVQVLSFDEQAGQSRLETLSADPTWTRLFCAENRDALDLAALIATTDDFDESSRRSQFSPRLGLSFPITASASLFFNFARFSQNPLYNNLFQGTGVGTPAEGTPRGPALFNSAYTVPFVGNPNLLIEETNSYEIGYLAEIGDELGLSVILFSKDQVGLTGLRLGGRDERDNQIFDEGITYGTSTPGYQILLNQDFTSVRGIELSLRKRLANHWAFDLNYAFSNARTNAAPPERQFERLDEGDLRVLREITSEVDQPHVFNGTIRFQVGNEPPLEGVLGDILQHTLLSFVARAASGLPYTPSSAEPGDALSFNPDRGELNSGRAPATFQLNMLAQKEFQIQNVRYGAFVQVINLTDKKNCIQVSPVTGKCTEGAFDFERRRRGNPVGEGATSTLLNRAHWVGQRRTIFAGLRLSF